MKTGKHLLSSKQPEKQVLCLDQGSNKDRTGDSGSDSCVCEVDSVSCGLSFREVFDVAADGMCIIDVNYNVVEISRLLQDSIQLPSSKRGPQKCFDVIGGAECHTSAAVQPNSYTEDLSLRRGFVDLACKEGVHYEYQRKAEPGIRSQRDSS